MKRKNCFKLVVGCWLLVVCLFVFTSQVSADTNTVNFLYDAGGQRIYKGVNGGEHTYYVYGSTRTLSGTLPTERVYTGQISDTDLTGLYYYNARYYNPQIAKFTQADSQGDALNKYAYVGNNPIIFTDPTGNMVVSDGGGG